MSGRIMLRMGMQVPPSLKNNRACAHKLAR